ncbi:uncharacterized protein BJ171DRAFT_471329 [Polychytrium aggregatum]|uniref:uncharacterized protein n=1 Tax=Polychytrium aggregatum TaxID=110093 RepID=UPI0022FE0F58|nr:uncharacterized protein BJ171DRAFT_471329 [Polychytrium aggregatum]KAI9209007.1 hypothetical protein BJ171DRAFT_471329 [Polychytrium aggregatum]
MWWWAGKGARPCWVHCCGVLFAVPVGGGRYPDRQSRAEPRRAVQTRPGLSIRAAGGDLHQGRERENEGTMPPAWCSAANRQRQPQAGPNLPASPSRQTDTRRAAAEWITTAAATRGPHGRAAPNPAVAKQASVSSPACSLQRARRERAEQDRQNRTAQDSVGPPPASPPEACRYMRRPAAPATTRRADCRAPSAAVGPARQLRGLRRCDCGPAAVQRRCCCVLPGDWSHLQLRLTVDMADCVL